MSFKDIFKNKHERENDRIAKKVEEEEAKKRKQEYNDAWAKVILFPGTKEAYEEFMNYESGTTEIIPLETTDKSITIYPVHKKNSIDIYDSIYSREELVDMGIEAILKTGCFNAGGESAKPKFYGPAIRRKDWNKDQNKVK